MNDLRKLGENEIKQWLSERNYPAFRGRQLDEWLWKRNAGSFDAMQNLPAALREQLSASFFLESVGISEFQESTDGSVKYALRLSDGAVVEMVLIPSRNRSTLCVSSQVGCPLNCRWCHNPESISTERQMARFQHLCRHCAKCTMDEATCPTRALKFYGKPATIDELVKKALEDKAFYDRTGGGVTLSGGEPLFFWEWAYGFLSACKAAGLHTCLDTSLYAPPAAIEKMLPVVDMWLPDFKCDDDRTPQKYTGVSNTVIKKNLERLVAAKADLEVRCLVVPGLTEDMAARYAYLDSIGISRKDVVKLEYLDYARSKYQALGMEDTMPPHKALDAK